MCQYCRRLVEARGWKGTLPGLTRRYPFPAPLEGKPAGLAGDRSAPTPNISGMARSGSPRGISTRVPASLDRLLAHGTSESLKDQPQGHLDPARRVGL